MDAASPWVTITSRSIRGVASLRGLEYSTRAVDQILDNQGQTDRNHASGDSRVPTGAHPRAGKAHRRVDGEPPDGRASQACWPPDQADGVVRWSCCSSVGCSLDPDRRRSDWQVVVQALTGQHVLTDDSGPTAGQENKISGRWDERP